MKWIKLSALMVLPAAVLVFHPLGCGVFYTCEDDATCTGARSGEDPMPDGEQCWNGKDDDGDGQADCADDDCDATSTCFEAVPVGFEGYHWIRMRNDVDGEPVPCSDGGQPTAYYIDPPNEEHACPTCECEFVNDDKSCQLPEIECWQGTECSGTKLQTNVVVDEPICVTSTGTGNQGGHCRISGEPTPPSATIIEGMTPPLPTWGQRLDVCHVPATGADCSTGKICVPRETHAADERMCIFAKGYDLECPTGWSGKLNAYEDGTDSRECTACGCDTSCDWNGYMIYTGTECKDGTKRNLKGTECTDITLQSKDDYYAVRTNRPKAASVAVGGEPTGAFIAHSPVTFCCKPAE